MRSVLLNQRLTLALVGLVAFAGLASACGGSAASHGGSGSEGEGGADASGPTGSGGASNATGSSGDGAGPSGSTSHGTGAGSTTGSGAGGACTISATQHTGDGTYYDADGSGNCSYDAMTGTGELLVGAMNHTDYADSAACGACAHLTGPKGEVTVRIVDQCPECKPGDIDLSPDAFQKLDDLSAGRITIHWDYIPCDVSGPISYHFKEGSNEYWTAVQIRNSRYAIQKLELKKDGQYVDVARVDYNYFVADSGMGPGPYTIRVTDAQGNMLEDSGVPFVEAGDSKGAAQFPDCSP